jgi:hypothetical protein
MVLAAGPNRTDTNLYASKAMVLKLLGTLKQLKKYLDPMEKQLGSYTT